MMDTRMITTAGSALATGVGLQWYKNHSKDLKIEVQPIVVDLVTAAAGLFGATQLAGITGDALSGLAIGAIAHAGAELSNQWFPVSYQVGGYRTGYSYPMYPVRSGSMLPVSTLEI